MHNFRRSVPNVHSYLLTKMQFTTIDICYCLVISKFNISIDVDEYAHWWINSDEKSKKYLLENIEIFRNVSVDLYVENNLEDRIMDRGQCLVLSMNKKVQIRCKNGTLMSPILTSNGFY